jgi:hypothetical protein
MSDIEEFRRDLRKEREKVKLALREAVKALYFDDSSDYRTALWKIVEYLGGSEACDLLEAEEEKAYEKYVELGEEYDN